MSPTGIEKVRLALGGLFHWSRIHGLLGMWLRLALMDTHKYSGGHPQIFRFKLVAKDLFLNPLPLMGFWPRESPDAPVIGFW